MCTRTAAGAGALTLGALTLVALAASPAAAVCDPYSGKCPEIAPTTRTAPPGGVDDAHTGASAGVLSGRATPPDAGTGPTSLPFTGGEVVLLSAVGAAALAGGAALVVAGRRRPRVD